jgi:hypothetical protein
VLQPVLESGTAVDRDGRSGGGVDGCDEVDCGMLHLSDFSKAARDGGLRDDKRTRRCVREGVGWGVITLWWDGKECAPE